MKKFDYRGKTVICIGHRLGGSERCATPDYIVVGLDCGLLEDTPIFWGEDGALNPLLLDVVGKIAEGLCLNAWGTNIGLFSW